MIADVLCNGCYFHRVVLELMVLGACQDSPVPRYLVCHVHHALQYAIFHEASLEVLLKPVQKLFGFLSPLLRETEGLMVWPDFLVKKDTE